MEVAVTRAATDQRYSRERVMIGRRQVMRSGGGGSCDRAAPDRAIRLRQIVRDITRLEPAP